MPTTKEGVRVITETIPPNGTYTLNLSYPSLVNGTLRFENSTQTPPDTVVEVTTMNFNNSVPITFTLTPTRYGVYFSQKPMNQLIVKNTSNSTSIELYFEYTLLEYFEPYNEIIQFITAINIISPPSITTLYQGANNRYNGSLANATFFSDMPVGTQVAIREVNVQSTSSSTVGNVLIPLCNNLYFFENISPLDSTINSNIAAFTSDLITNNLPSGATLNNATVPYMIVDYLFDFNLQVQFVQTYNINSSGDIVFGGYIYAYYFNNPSAEFSNAKIDTDSVSNSAYTLTPEPPTLMITDSSGKVNFNLTQPLTPTSDLSATVSASTTIAGITRSASATGAPNFNYNINILPPPTTYNPTSYNGGNDVVFSSNTTLTGDIVAVNITINSGVTLTTNGYSLIATNTFQNNGTVSSGQTGLYENFPNSYGGSGGGGAAGGCGSYSNGNSGYSTLAPGGAGSIFGSGCDSTSGSTPSQPSLTNTEIYNWYVNGINQYLCGAAGGNNGGNNANYVGTGGNGLYIQANNITNNGVISTVGGGSGPCGSELLSYAGSGGGGSVLLAYHNSLKEGTIYTNGGGTSCNAHSGGSGLVMVYQYSTPPVQP